MAHFFSLHTMKEMILFAVLALNRSESIQGLECDQKLNLRENNPLQGDLHPREVFNFARPRGIY